MASSRACWRSAIAVERDVLRCFGDADDHARCPVAGRNPFGMIDIEIAGQRDGRRASPSACEAVAQRDLQAALIGCQQAVEAALEQPVEPAVLLSPLGLSRRAHIIGVSVSEITSERTSDALTVTANSRNSRPT